MVETVIADAPRPGSAGRGMTGSLTKACCRTIDAGQFAVRQLSWRMIAATHRCGMNAGRELRGVRSFQTRKTSVCGRSTLKGIIEMQLYNFAEATYRIAENWKRDGQTVLAIHLLCVRAPEDATKLDRLLNAIEANDAHVAIELLSAENAFFFSICSDRMKQKLFADLRSFI